MVRLGLFRFFVLSALSFRVSEFARQKNVEPQSFVEFFAENYIFVLSLNYMKDNIFAEKIFQVNILGGSLLQKCY